MSYRLYHGLVLGSVVAVILLATLFALIDPDMAAVSPLRPHGALGPSMTNGYMVLMGPVVAAWGISVHYRSTGTILRSHLAVAAMLLALCPLLPLLRYPLEDASTLSRLLWYAYYLPFVHVPTLLLFCAIRSAALETRHGAQAFIRLDGALGILLSSLVLTNEVHRLFFLVDSPLTRSVSYGYGPLYWVTMAFIIANCLAFFGVLFKASRTSKRTALSSVGILMVLGTAYCIAYTLGVTRLPLDNLPMQFVLVCVCVIEYCLDMRLLPSYAGYWTLFRALPLKLEVLSDRLTPVFSTTAVTHGISKEARESLARSLPLGHGSSLALPSSPGTTTTAFGITGGVAVLTESTTEMDLRRASLEKVHDDLERGNETLRRRRDIEAALYRQEREQELFRDVNESLLWATSAIGRLLDNLPSEKDVQAAEERRRSLVLVRLLLAYSKRKGALVLDEQANRLLDVERLNLVLGETMADVALAGIDGGALVEVGDPLPAATFSVIYDCLYDFVTTSFVNEDPTLMVFLHEYGTNSVELRIAMECASLDVSCADELRELLARRNVSYRLAEDDETLKLSVIVPRTVSAV